MNISGSMNLKNIIGAAAFTCAVFAGIGYAFSAEKLTVTEPVCYAHISKLKGVTVTDLSEAEQAALIAKKGAPPAKGRFATVTTDKVGIFIIHDGDCATFFSGKPVPLDQLDRFLGRVNA